MSAWPVAALQDVASIRAGGTPPRGLLHAYGGSIPWAKIADLTTSDGRLTNTEERITQSAASTFRIPVFPPGTVLLAMYGSIGASAIADVATATNQAIVGIQCVPALSPEYLHAYLRHVRVYLTDLGRGGTQANINAGHVRSLKIPLPPLEEQRRIAARLREQLAEVGLVAAAAQARIDQIDGLAQQAIDAAIPASDAIALGHTLRTPLRTGLSRAASATANHRVLTLSSVRNGVLDVGRNRPMDATDDEALANAVRPSTFYVVRGNGSLHMAGAGALSPESTDGVVLYPDLLIQVDPDPSLLLVEYLALAWRSRRVRQQVETRLRTSAGIHKINLANLSTVEVPLPMLAEQRRIAARLREQLAEIDQAKAALEAQRAAIDALPAAFLREVFGPAESLDRTR